MAGPSSILVVPDNPSPEQRLGSLMNAPIFFRILGNNALGESFGSTPVNGNGALIPFTPAWVPVMSNLKDQTAQNTPVSSTATAANTLITTYTYLFPPHGALNVLGYTLQCPVGVTNSGTSNSATLDKVVVSLVKVSSAGTVTVLRSDTFTSGFVNQTSTYSLTNCLFNYYFGSSPLAIAGGTTERFGIQIQLYGHDAAGTSYFALTADGGAAGSPPTSSGNYPLLFGLKF